MLPIAGFIQMHPRRYYCINMWKYSNARHHSALDKGPACGKTVGEQEVVIIGIILMTAMSPKIL